MLTVTSPTARADSVMQFVSVIVPKTLSETLCNSSVSPSLQESNVIRLIILLNEGTVLILFGTYLVSRVLTWQSSI